MRASLLCVTLVPCAVCKRYEHTIDKLYHLDEQVLQDGEWQQQQQLVRGGGGDDEEDEDEEQPASGAEERVHAEEADAEAGALTWQELLSGWGGIMLSRRHS